MFFLNEKVDFLIFDSDHIEKPDECIRPFLGGPYYIHVIAKSNRDLIQACLKHSHPPKKWLVIDGNEVESEGLEKWMSARQWAFHDVFITSANDRVLIANERAIGTVLVKESIKFEDLRTGADMVLSSSDLKHLADYHFYAGHAGEINVEPAPHLLPGADKVPNAASKFSIFQPNFNEYESAWSLGRFFNSTDPFLNTHLYSRFIKCFKDNPDRLANKTNLLLKQTIEHLAKKEGLGKYLLSYAPKKPSDPLDRNEIMLQNFKDSHGHIYHSLLECPNDYKSQKNAGSYANRRANVRGKYRAKYKLNGESVILIDDIYTSGATLAECATQLKNNGAGKIVSLSLATVCDPTFTPLLNLSCSNCGNPLKIWFKKKGGAAFWNCYKHEGCSVNYMDYADGVKRLRQIRNLHEDTFPGF